MVKTSCLSPDQAYQFFGLLTLLSMRLSRPDPRFVAKVANFNRIAKRAAANRQKWAERGKI